MHSFVSPSVVMQFEWATTNVAKPIMVQLAQGATTPTSEAVLGATLECSKVKFTKKTSWFVPWITLKPS